VNRRQPCRSAPIRFGHPDLAGADGASAQLGRDISQVITNDLGQLRAVPPLPPASFIQSPTRAEVPNFQNWSTIGAQALVTGRAEAQGGNIRIEFRSGTCCRRRQIQGTAYTTRKATGAASPTSSPT